MTGLILLMFLCLYSWYDVYHDAWPHYFLVTTLHLLTPTNVDQRGIPIHPHSPVKDQTHGRATESRSKTGI